jgi:pimeloyl-ACP methyl ester carboxylesterase
VVGNANVVTFDLPGNGRLNAARSPTSVETMAEFCRGELRARDIAPPYFVLAMSLGAMVAVEWASRYPHELSGCALINTSLRPLCPFWWRLKPANYGTVLRLALFNHGAREHEAAILRMTSRLVQADATASAAVLGAWVAFRNEFPVSRGNALRQLFAAARYRAPSARPATRLLVLTSAPDALVDTRCSQRLARAWQADLAVHPDAGHDLPLDDGAWIAQRVREWLKS